MTLNVSLTIIFFEVLQLCNVKSGIIMTDLKESVPIYSLSMLKRRNL